MDSSSRLPYFNRILEKLDQKGAKIAHFVGRNVHWGYWEESQPDLTPLGIAKATDDLTRQLVREADFKPSTVVLDVGCGFGGTIALLNETFSDLTLTGLNLDERQIARAEQQVTPQARNGNKINFVVGNACALPFPDQFFDVVLAVECIFHFPSRAIFFREAARVLKPGGRLVLSDFLTAPFSLPVVAAIYSWYVRDCLRVYGKNSLPLGRAGYRKLAKQTGLRVTSERDITRQTLPIYKVLWDTAPEFGDWATTFRRANRFGEIVSKMGIWQYTVLAYEKS